MITHHTASVFGTRSPFSESMQRKDKVSAM
jgi:hypothetical protein